MCGSDVFLGIVAILFPPLAVWVKRGICSADSLINIALCCIGFLPGLIHAWYIISAYPDPTYEHVEQDPEGGRVTYYYVQQGGAPPAGSQRQPRSYGTVASTPSKQFPGQQQGTVPPQQYQSEQAQMGGASSSRQEEVPPTYAEAVQGDHKVQSHD
ncbi:hypothetical protein MBLNU459_g1859t1 [Dothideomycetes sp. NU459]